MSEYARQLIFNKYVGIIVLVGLLGFGGVYAYYNYSSAISQRAQSVATQIQSQSTLVSLKYPVCGSSSFFNSFVYVFTSQNGTVIENDLATIPHNVATSDVWLWKSNTTWYTGQTVWLASSTDPRVRFSVTLPLPNVTYGCLYVGDTDR